MQNLANWDAIGDPRPLSQVELEKKAEEIEEFKKGALLEEICGGKNPEKLGLRKVTKTQGFSTKWLTPIGDTTTLTT